MGSEAACVPESLLSPDPPAASRSRWIPPGLELALSLAALGGSVLLNYAAGRFSDRQAAGAPSCPDLLLRHLPVVDLRFLFVWGFAVFVAWAAAMTLWREPKRLAHVAWSYALLIALRSLFINLTPMSQPLGALNPEGDALFDRVGRYMTFRHDLFFSSHTALPFLGFLLFRERWVRLSFLALSFLMAATVLLTRVHYSIDVAAAYFITYALHCFERRHLRRFWAFLDRRGI